MDNPTVFSSATGAQQMTQSSAALMVDQMFKSFNAWLAFNNGSSGLVEQTVFTLDLTTARTEEEAIAVPLAFRSLFIRDASDNNAYVFLKPFTRDTSQGSSKLRNNTLWESGDLPCPRAYLWWPAQSGKTMVLEFHVRGRVVPGNTQSTSYVTEGSSATSGASGSVTTSAASLLAADTDRKVSTIYNQGPSDILVGGSTVTNSAGARPGIPVLAGSFFQWKNSGALYAITDAGTATIAILDEK